MSDAKDDNIWCVKPEQDTIDLEWDSPAGVRKFSISVKKRLTVGEERRIMTAGWRSMSSVKQEPQPATGLGVQEAAPPPSTEIQIDWRAQTFARSEVYLLSWTLPVPLTREGIESLDPDVYAIIENAITAHKEAMDKAKKLRTGSSAPERISA